MRRQWQSKNFDGIETPLAYTFRRARWFDRPIWTQYSVWWYGISVVAGFDIDHPFLWYLLLWLPDSNRVSHNNCLLISGSVSGISTTANIPPGEVSIVGAVSGMRIDLSGVSGIAITEGLALGFGMAYSTSSVLEVDGILTEGLALLEVSGIAITEGLALGFGMAYSTSSVLEVDGIAYSNQAFEQLRFAYANEQYTFFYGSELTDFCY